MTRKKRFRVEKALKNLNRLLSEIDSLRFGETDNWKAELKEYLKDYLGENSKLYEALSEFSFYNLYSFDDSNYEEQVYFEKQKGKAKELVNRCITYIQTAGLDQSNVTQKKNLLSDLSNPFLYTLLIGILAAGFTLGELEGRISQSSQINRLESEIRDCANELNGILPERKLEKVDSPKKEKTITGPSISDPKSLEEGNLTQ